MMSSRSAAERLTRWYRWFVREELAPQRWLRDGALRPLLIALAALTPFALAGAVRTNTGLGLGPSLAVAALVVALISVPLWPALVVREPGAWGHLALALGAMAAVSGFAVSVLYSRYFAGLPNFRGTDPGFHIFYYHQFVRVDHAAYNGFTVMYGALYFVQRLFGCNDFWALCIVYYSQLVLVCALPLVVTFCTLWKLRASSAAYWLGVALAIPIAGLVQYFVLLPQQHQYQADGFYPQLFALLPLMGAWLVDALVRAAPLRVFLLLFTFVVYRFTYGLNLGDLALAVAAVLLLDLADGRLRPWFRVALAVGAVALVVVAREIYVELWPLQSAIGHFLAYDVRATNDAQVLGLAMLLLTMAASSGPRALFAGSGLRRAARFPFLFGLISLGALLSYAHFSQERRYYFQKYPLHALVLVVSACSALLPVLLARGAAELRLRGWRRVLTPAAALVAAVLVAAAGAKVYAATMPHRIGFLQRAWAKPPYHEEYNLPLADLGAWSRIQKVLKKEQKTFAGYVTSQFGMMMFMNAAFDIPDFGWKIWFGPGPVPGVSGSCMFWDEGPSSLDWWIWESGFPLRGLRKQLKEDPLKDCSVYVPHWNPKGPRRILCHRCY